MLTLKNRKYVMALVAALLLAGAMLFPEPGVAELLRQAALAVVAAQ